MEAAATQTLDTLTEKLKTFQETQHALIQEFVTVQTQNLKMDLDEFRFHAQETLHAGIFGPDMPNPRAPYVEPPSRAIPVEEPDEPARGMEASRTACSDSETPRTGHQAGSTADISAATVHAHHSGMAPQRTPTPLNPATPNHPMGAAPTEPMRTSRWKNVDYEALRAGTTMDYEASRAHHMRSPPNIVDGRSTRQNQDQKPLTHDAREDYIARLRKTPTPMQLRGQERQAVVTWYNSFVDFLKTYRVPIKIFEEFQLHNLDDPKEVLYPSTLDDQHLYDR